MAKARILIVDDEPTIQELIQYNLNKESYETVLAKTGEEAVVKAKYQSFDLILLDLMLPEMDGLEACKLLKNDEETARIPIIMLTAKSDDADIITGLELGADDYLTKPFSPKILIARIRAVLRRYQKNDNSDHNFIHVHNIFLDLDKHIVELDNKPLDLSLTEFKILQLLASYPGRVFSRDHIIVKVKGDDYPVTERSVDVQILSLRRKLGESGNLIETVRGLGYKMVE